MAPSFLIHVHLYSDRWSEGQRALVDWETKEKMISEATKDPEISFMVNSTRKQQEVNQKSGSFAMMKARISRGMLTDYAFTMERCHRRIYDLVSCPPNPRHVC